MSFDSICVSNIKKYFPYGLQTIYLDYNGFIDMQIKCEMNPYGITNIL